MFRNFIWSMFLLFVFSSIANALEVNIKYASKVEFNFDTGNYDRQAGSKGTNWVAIYKSGSSNDWKNVIQWAWVKDLEKHKYTNKIRYMKLNALDSGKYDIRFFENNSYDIFRSISFTKNAHESFLRLYEISKNKIGVLISDIDLLAKDTWIAVFHKGDSNEWKNVIDWSWCQNGGPGSEYFEFNTLNYASGKYEIRLFLNNSYTPVSSLEFTKLGGAEIPKLGVAIEFANVITFWSTHEDDGKSWIGLFKHGTPSTQENLVVWKYATSDRTDINIDGVEEGVYDVRLFYKDSYDVEAEVNVGIGDRVFIDTPIIVNDYNHFSKQIRYMYGTPLNDKDWLAIFKKGYDHISNNVITWRYVGNNKDALNVYYTNIRVNDLENGEYDLVYFLNDSYEQHGLTGKITIDR